MVLSQIPLIIEGERKKAILGTATLALPPSLSSRARPPAPRCQTVDKYSGRNRRTRARAKPRPLFKSLQYLIHYSIIVREEVTVTLTDCMYAICHKLCMHGDMICTRCKLLENFRPAFSDAATGGNENQGIRPCANKKAGKDSITVESRR